MKILCQATSRGCQNERPLSGRLQIEQSLDWRYFIPDVFLLNYFDVQGRNIGA